jgi:glycosyltransferase involved in cell wall biosynthesis
VIPTRNRVELLARTLSALEAQDYPADRFEVFVVDNGSTDGTVDMVRQVQSLTRVNLHYLTGANRGPAPARNLGAQHASGDLLAFTDSDCEPTTGWLSGAVAGFDRDPSIGLVCGPVKVPGDPEEPLAALPLRARFVHVDRENPFYPTANVCYRKSVFLAEGGFPESYGKEIFGQLQGGDDCELAWRVKRSGHRAEFSLDVAVYHAIHLCTWSQWFSYTLIFANTALSLRMAPEIRRVFPLRFLLPWIWLRVYRRDLRRPSRWPAVAGRFTAWTANHLFLTGVLLYSSVIYRSPVL